MARATTANSDAYQLYAKGRHFWALRGRENLQQAIRYFNQAIAADPNYSLAYAGLSDAYNVAPGYGVIAPSDAVPLSISNGRKAVELDPNSSEAHSAYAGALGSSLKWEEAEKEYRRAIELNPNNATAHYLYAFIVLYSLKRFDEALVELRTALALDPLSPILNVNYGVALMAAHHTSEAQAQFQHTIEIAPNFQFLYWKYGAFLASQGQYAEASKQWKKSFAASTVTGNDKKALSESMLVGLKARSAIGYVPSAMYATAYAIAGDRDKVFELLEQAMKEVDHQVPEMVRYPVFDQYRSDPKFKAFMHRLNIPD